MSKLKPLEFNSSRIHMKQNHWAGWLAVALGLGVTRLPDFVDSMQADAAMVQVVGGIFALFGLLAAFYRVEVILDLASRKYEVTQGFWPAPATYQGGLDELKGLYFEKEWRTSRNDNRQTTYLVWTVGIQLPDRPRPIIFYESNNEGEAQQYFEKAASLIKIKTVDLTGDKEEVRNWDELDETVDSQLSNIEYEPVDLESPPRELTLQRANNGVAYWTQAKGLNPSSLFMGAFASLFLFIGFTGVATGLELNHQFTFQDAVSESKLTAVFVGAVFILVSLVIFRFAFNHAATRYRIAFLTDEIRYTTFVRNKQKKEFKALWNQIEKFELRASTASIRASRTTIGSVTSYKYSDAPQELYIRTHDDLCVIQNFEPLSTRFLYNAFYQLLEQNQKQDEKVS